VFGLILVEHHATTWTDEMQPTGWISTEWFALLLAFF
jgi:hypothetical protein